MQISLALLDHVQHSCASRIINSHHLPLRYTGCDRELGESTARPGQFGQSTASCQAVPCSGCLPVQHSSNETVCTISAIDTSPVLRTHCCCLLACKAVKCQQS
jgi:hypothetical protein